ncbi:amidase [Alteromonas lipolytica]|uniref:Amidase n=1 Tax=Alteromonas lipolytica TaxID=1856405 RepID=A0A1E8FHY0_9ALTE|nr:amidase [Alteromonas lipolytica]OFI35531.1 amidase [Alteromonas lipolytica]GGF77003.1 amidase [Alteromonas lipolytica]
MAHKLVGIALLLTLLMSCASQTKPQTDSKWLDAPVAEQVAAIKRGELTSEGLVTGYLARIESLDKSGPTLNSILRLNANALAEAQKRDAALANGETPGPLHGIPVLLKDNIETLDMPTTAGSLALLDNVTRRDSPLVASLRKAGAIILGKTNLSEWANFRSEASISGWSAVGGLTRNPHMLSRSACGSSSGSGAAMAAGLASLAVGTETNGSIICPSAMNGIVGFKPTVGLIPRTHIVPISATQDTAGPMARSVGDAALMASVMAATDASDEVTLDTARPDSQSLLSLSGDITGLKIGVVRYRQGDNPQIIGAVDNAIQLLRTQGASVVEIAQFEQPKDFWEKSYLVLLAEFKTTINDYLFSSPARLPVRNLNELIGFNKTSKREMQLFDQSIFVQAAATEGMAGSDYQQALADIRMATRSQGIDKLLADYDVDVLIAPSNNPAFLIDAVYGDSAPKGFIGIGYLAAIAGYPHLTVPLTSVKGLPVGLSIIGGRWQDAKVLNAGLVFEQVSQFRLAPAFVPTGFDSAAMAGTALPYKAPQ